MTIKEEMQTAREKYGAFNSTHEVYGVLAEEVDEFWECVKQQPEWKEKEAMINELTQIAAIAQRAIKELENNEIKWV